LPGSVSAIIGRSVWNGSARRHTVLLRLSTGRIAAGILAGKRAGTAAGTTTTGRAASVRVTADHAKTNMGTAAAETAVADSQA